MRGLALALALTAPLVPLAGACSADAGQHEITAPGELLTSDGRLREPGWAPRQLLHWDATRVDDSSRLRQWDFFTVLDGNAAVNLTLVDLGFVRAATVGVVDLATGAASQSTAIAGVDDEFALSAALEGTASLSAAGATGPLLRFDDGADGSVLTIDIPSPLAGSPAQGTLTIHRRPEMPYLSLATPFSDDPHEFFFEQKVPGMTADGSITLGDQTWSFGGATAVMDWGRGEWPSEVSWQWAAASGTAGGASLAFNFGEGFGDPRAGSENLIVYDDVPAKLAAIDWTYSVDDPTQDWTFASADGRVALVLHPIAPETGGLDLGAKYQHVHKAYGLYSGTIVLDDQRTIQVDGLLGFAEEVDISW